MPIDRSSMTDEQMFEIRKFAVEKAIAMAEATKTADGSHALNVEEIITLMEAIAGFMIGMTSIERAEEQE